MKLIDFTTGPIHYRLQHATIRGEALARALGLKKNFRPKVLDATAGLGQDSFILAALGCEVYLVERCKAVYQQLRAALAHARTVPELEPIIQRMHLFFENAISFLDHLPFSPDVIYLDPMFPEKTKSAAVRKNMLWLQQTAGKDLDADHLLIKALSHAARIVVKRPRYAVCLAGIQPDFTLPGKSSRFDVYLRPHHGNTTATS